MKLTLGKPDGRDASLRNLFVRPVRLKSGPRLAFVWRHATKDVTKNLSYVEALAQLEALIGADFLDAHLFTEAKHAQLETGSGKPRLRVTQVASAPAAASGNDREKRRVVAPQAPWLHALGVTDDRGRPLAPMNDKFRQIDKFTEILGHLVGEAPLPTDRKLSVYDMGCGKGYLTFAASQLLGQRASVRGIERRADLVDFCNAAARDLGFGERLEFETGSIADTPVVQADVMIALHACDTATDDALAKGIAAGATLLVVAPCCQKEVRPQLQPPTVLSGAMRHGIFRERQAEFVTDALRAQLLEWAGYRTRVFEFVSTEHTAKNTMISAVRTGTSGATDAAAVRAFASFYGVRSQALATHLGFALE